MLGCFFVVVSFEILNAKLTVRFVVLWIKIYDSFVDWNRLVSHICYEVKCLGKTEVRWNRVWFKFHCVFEVFGRFDIVSCVRQERC